MGQGVPDRLAQRRLDATQIEQVVVDLECDPQAQPVRAQVLDLLVRSATEERAENACRHERCRGLAPDDGEVTLLRDRSIAAIQLFELTAAARLGQLTQRPYGIEHACRRMTLVRLAQRVEGPDEQVIAEHERRALPDAPVQRRQASPLVRLVDQIVVKERSPVEQLDRLGSHQRFFGIAADRTAREKHQRRTQHLPAPEVLAERGTAWGVAQPQDEPPPAPLEPLHLIAQQGRWIALQVHRDPPVAYHVFRLPHMRSRSWSATMAFKQNAVVIVRLP